MHTAESLKMMRLFGAVAPRSEESKAESGAFGSLLLSKMRIAGSTEWPRVNPKPGGVHTREVMRMALKNGEEIEVTPIGQGIHRPYRVVFANGVNCGAVTTKQAALKTIHCQFENKRYCKSVDLKITGPEREILSFALDCVLGFDLVPPTLGREVHRIGFGSVQAWVDAPTAWQWKSKGYDYREDKKNPWLHRLAAFDFIRGEIDRHANNWLMDADRRVYAIDNGYAFVKGDDRTWMRSSAGRHLVGETIHPTVIAEIRGIDEDKVARALDGWNFKNGEGDGVLARIRQLKTLDVWEKLGNLW